MSALFDQASDDTEHEDTAEDTARLLEQLAATCFLLEQKTQRESLERAWVTRLNHVLAQLMPDQSFEHVRSLAELQTLLAQLQGDETHRQ